jgi:predicted nucleic acid-binding protein
MMRALINTNVVLDHLLDRQPFAADATALWVANARGQFEAYISAITPINVFYIARKLKDANTARIIVTSLLAACRVCLLDETALQMALALSLRDYEDAVQVASATQNHMDAIITRDTRDFVGVTLPVSIPADFLKRLS